MANTATAQRDGILVRGVYEGSRQAKGFTRKDGSTAEPVELGVRIGDDVVAVRYDAADKAQQAHDEAGSPAPGEVIELPVFVRLYKDHDRRLAFITYEGQRSEPQGGGWS